VNTGYFRFGYESDGKLAGWRTEAAESIEGGEQAIDLLVVDNQLRAKITDLRSLRLVRAFVHASSFCRMTYLVP